MELNVPTCCGEKMTVSAATGKFLETHCEVCDDFAYIKREMHYPLMVRT